jgi:pimeloyl-ACP methyl ester carboxylesterase
VWKPRTLRYREGVVASPRGDGPQTRRVIILVHGFNNDFEKAAENYRAFARALGDLGGPRLGPQEWSQVWKFFWPGYEEPILFRTFTESPHILARALVADASGSESNALLSAATYPRQVGKARQVGVALADYLIDAAHGVLEVILIGHSLGCRVALEVLRRIDERGNPVRVPAVCLMAAAVPTYMAAQSTPGSLGSTLRQVERTHILFSARDTVLAYTFPAGQALAGEGLYPEAVGLNGRPSGLWRARDNTRLRHGQYWASSVMASHALRLLGLVPPNRDHLSGEAAFEPIERPLPVADLPVAMLPDSERTISSRDFIEDF